MRAATDLLIGRAVAARTLLQYHSEAAPQEVESFFREARTAGSLSHRGIVTVHDVGQDSGGTLCLVMELIPAGTWEGAPAPLLEAEKIVRRLALTGPATYEPRLAATLFARGFSLGRLGRREEQLLLFREAEEISRRWTAEDRVRRGGGCHPAARPARILGG